MNTEKERTKGKCVNRIWENKFYVFHTTLATMIISAEFSSICTTHYRHQSITFHCTLLNTYQIKKTFQLKFVHAYLNKYNIYFYDQVLRDVLKLNFSFMHWKLNTLDRYRWELYLAKNVSCRLIKHPTDFHSATWKMKPRLRADAYT
jgi:hypothetical protein